MEARWEMSPVTERQRDTRHHRKSQHFHTQDSEKVQHGDSSGSPAKKSVTIAAMTAAP